MTNLLTIIIPIMAVASKRIGQVFDLGRQYILTPVGRVFDLVFGPVDRLLDPVANRFNRYLGPYFGELTGLQFGFLALSVVGLLTGGIWGEFILQDIRRELGIACIWAIFVMGWDIQSGYTGYISFGHSVLSGGAAYTTALLLTQVDPGLSIWVTAPVSVLAAVVIGLVIGLPSLRLRGPYFSLITFVAVLLFYQLTLAISDLGGQSGLGIDRLLSPAELTVTYYTVLVPMLLIAVALTFLARSNLGLILVAIRENEDAVSAAGINPTKFKIWSFTLSSVAMGIGGVLLTATVSNVTPTQFVVVDRSIEMIAIAVIGGMSSILGPLGGSFLFFILRDGFLTLFFEGAIRNFLLFIVVVLVLVFARDGLFRKIWHRLGDVGGDDS